MNMNKIGKRILAAAVASSVLVTPVFADPSVDDLKKSKESAQNEVFRHSQIWKMPRQKNRNSMQI